MIFGIGLVGIALEDRQNGLRAKFARPQLPAGSDGPRRDDAGSLDYAADAAPQALRGLAERLAVVTRGAIANDMALAIALARGVPVLSIDPRERD